MTFTYLTNKVRSGPCLECSYYVFGCYLKRHIPHSFFSFKCCTGALGKAVQSTINTVAAEQCKDKRNQPQERLVLKRSF